MWFATGILAFALTALLSCVNCQDEIERGIVVEGQEQVIERLIQLPKLRCNTSFKFRVLVESQLAIDFQATQISTSCGCISRLPSQWELKPHQKSELEFQVTTPKTPEKARRYVTLSDIKAGQSIRIGFEFHVAPLIALPAAIDVSQAETTTLSIPISTNFDELDLSKCSCLAQSGHIKATLRAENRGVGVLELAIDPEICPETQVQTPISLDFFRETVLIERSSPMIRFRNRVAVVPNPIVFERYGDTWNANAVIQSQALHDWLILKRPSQVVLVNGTKDLDKKVQVEYSLTDSPVTMLRMQIPAKTRMTIDRIRIEAGEWKVETPATINNP